ncbi:MAG: MbnP family protein [Saprospiraceae bacterium]
MKYYFFLILLISCGTLRAQQKILVNFNLLLEEKPINITDERAFSESYPIQIEALKFYLSKVELLHENILVFSEKNSFHLLDASDKTTLSFPLEIPDSIIFTTIKFNIGIDSLTNISGAFGGDLDPTNGMYWTWQSGYINFKLEGFSIDCPARHNRFQFHIGGYQFPNNSLQEVRLETTGISSISINLSIDEIFTQIDLKEINQIMSPNEKSQYFSSLLPQLFSIAK